MLYVKKQGSEEDLNKCHAEHYCRQSSTDRCHEFCIGYVQLENVYELSNIPKKYQYELPLTSPTIDRDSYIRLKDFMDNIKENVELGNGVFLYSERKGNGKTSWACKLMNAYLRHVALTNNMRCRGLFVNVPRFLQDIRNNFSNPSEQTQDMIKEIHRADLVIWDDIGAENPSDWVRESLYSFISTREADNLSQIYTSNVSLETLRSNEYLGERIVSRILGQCMVIKFFGDDMRQYGK